MPQIISHVDIKISINALELIISHWKAGCLVSTEAENDLKQAARTRLMDFQASSSREGRCALAIVLQGPNTIQPARRRDDSAIASTREGRP